MYIYVYTYYFNSSVASPSFESLFFFVFVVKCSYFSSTINCFYFRIFIVIIVIIDSFRVPGGTVEVSFSFQTLFPIHSNGCFSLCLCCLRRGRGSERVPGCGEYYIPLWVAVYLDSAPEESVKTIENDFSFSCANLMFS